MCNHKIDEFAAAEVDAFNAQELPRQGPRTTSKAPSIKHPNLGAGYLLPLLMNLLYQLAELVDPTARATCKLTKCQPLAFHVYFGVKRR